MARKLIKIVCLFVLVYTSSLLLASEKQSNSLVGKVIGVTDGDTIKILDSNNVQHKIRLLDIDAPESRQAFGTKSKESLSEKIFAKQVRVDWKKHDRYKRILGHVFLDDRWINKEMIEEGWAWHYKKYSDDESLSEAEEIARSKKRGLWTDLDSSVPPIEPWNFRSKKKTTPKTIPKATSPKNLVYITNSGSKYHADGCRHLKKSKISVSLDQARARGYDPCKVCNP